MTSESAEGRTAVPVTLDREADAAYIHLQPSIGPDAVTRTVTVDVHGTGVDVFVELDARGRVLGIELLHASSALPDPVLQQMRDVPDPT